MITEGRTQQTTAATDAVNGKQPGGFWSFILTQFQGAFSDMTLKNLVTFTILGMGLPQDKRDSLVPIVGALFALPFILFSMVGGYCADRFSKRSVTIGVKVFEIGVMLFAAAGLILKNLPMELTAVFLMGVHSAIFGPSKYGLIPELLPESKLSWGNGIVELGTFVAIILGTAAGAILSDLFRGQQGWSGLILIGLAICGLWTSLGISKFEAANVQRKFRMNFLADLAGQLREIRKDRVLTLAMVGSVYFSFLAALLQLNIILYGKDVLHLGDTQNGYLQASVAIGIGLGSLAAGFLSSGKIGNGLIPLGSIGLTLFALVPSFFHLSFLSFAICLALLGLFAGFFIVPISTLLQRRPEKAVRGGVLAAVNLLSFAGVFAASGIYYLMNTLADLSPAAIFLCSAILTGLGTLLIFLLLPESFNRLFTWVARQRTSSYQFS